MLDLGLGSVVLKPGTRDVLGYPGSSQDTVDMLDLGLGSGVLKPGTRDVLGYPGSSQDTVGHVRPGTWQWGAQARYMGCPGISQVIPGCSRTC